VTLEVRPGSRFALLGPNGAGKSTLTKVLSTLVEPDEGEVLVAGHDARSDRVAVRRSIGVALQDVTLDPNATPRELLTFHARLFETSRSEAMRVSEELLKRFELRMEASKKVGTLSGGNQRRLHVALALVHRPAILFLDEPTVGMDPEGRELFWNEMRRLNREQGCTLFLTTQYLEEAERHADQMAIIAGGSIAYRGEVASFNALGEFRSLEERYLAFVRSKKEVLHE
jgi:ABC-2 type transport system ATP-binding protein